MSAEGPRVFLVAGEPSGDALAGPLIAALRQESDARQAERLYEQLSVIRSSGQRFLTDVATIAGWRQRLRYARTNLFPSAAYMRTRYEIRHRLLVPLYYPYRWWRGLRGLR